jgi:hypothetical protein
MSPLLIAAMVGGALGLLAFGVIFALAFVIEWAGS